MTDNQKEHLGDDMSNRNNEHHESYDFVPVDASDLERMSATDGYAPSRNRHNDPLGEEDDRYDEHEHEHDYDADEQDFERDHDRPSNLKKYIIAGCIAGVLVLGLFGFFVSKVIFGGQGSAPAQARTMDDLSFSSELTAEQGSSLPTAVSADAKALDAAINSSGIAGNDQLGAGVDAGRHDANEPGPIGDQGKNLVVTYGAESLEPVVPTGGVDSNAIQAVRAVTEEERLYDSLLTSVEGMDVPPEAIKIDHRVVNRTLESQRIGGLEADLESARQAITVVNHSVDGIREQVASFAQAIERNSKDQASVMASLAQLSKELKKVSDNQDKEIKALRDAVAKAQARADQAVSQAGDAKKVAQTAKAERPAPAAKVVQASHTQTPAAARPVQPTHAAMPAKVFTERPTPPTVQATSPVGGTNSNLPAQCDGRQVSSVWRVKGVNSQSAYIVRSQDQEGLYLKLGLDVPGYGQVLGFDASNRAVCTTSGLIRR